MLRRFKVYWQVWKMMAENAWQEAFINRGTTILFFLGKLFRLGMMLLFLWLVRQNVRQFSGYTTDEIIVFFLTYQLVDLLAQILYRGVYMFSHEVRSGDFDFLLAKPISPLFRSLVGKPDINDTLFLFPTLAFSFWLISQLQLNLTLSSIGWYLLMLINSLMIATALHILVLVVGILTTEIDGVIWLYRDLIRLGQFPVTIYPQLLRLALFIVIPVGVMITIPANLLLNRSSLTTAGIALLFGLAFLLFSLKMWNWGLKKYSSASS